MSTTYEQLEPVISALDERIKTSFGAFPTDTASGVIATFIDGADNVPVKSLVVGINPVQSGEGDPSPTNIRPINGWTGANVARTGKNLFDVSNAVNATNVVDNVEADGTIHFKDVTARWANTYVGKIYVVKGQTYVISASNIEYGRFGASTSPTANPQANTFPDITVNEVGASPSTMIKRTTKSCKFSANFTGYMYLFYCSDLSYDGYHAPFVTQIQIEFGSTVTEYEPYTGETIDVSFPTEAGTVYGGSLDVTNGVLTVDRATVDLGTMSWFYQNSAGHERFGGTGIRGTVAVPVSADVVINAQCSRYKVISASQVYNHNAGIGISVTNSDGTIYVYDDAYTDSNAFRTAMSGVQFCYPLATPITYQLIPHEVKSLLGYNNIWADTGGTTVGYRADTSDYIAKKIAEAISALS